MDNLIHIPARKKAPVTRTQVVKISADAYNALVDI